MISLMAQTGEELDVEPARLSAWAKRAAGRLFARAARAIVLLNSAEEHLGRDDETFQHLFAVNEVVRELRGAAEKLRNVRLAHVEHLLALLNRIAGSAHAVLQRQDHRISVVREWEARGEERGYKARCYLIAAQSAALDIMAQATVESADLARLVGRTDHTATPSRGQTPDAIRSRRKRERRGRGARRVDIDVYGGDLDLLRRFGFLAAGDDSKEGVGRAVEQFLLVSFLTHVDETSPWQDRVIKQRNRAAALLGHALDIQRD